MYLQVIRAMHTTPVSGLDSLQMITPVNPSSANSAEAYKCPLLQSRVVALYPHSHNCIPLYFERYKIADIFYLSGIFIGSVFETAHAKVFSLDLLFTNVITGKAGLFQKNYRRCGGSLIASFCLKFWICRLLRPGKHPLTYSAVCL